VNAILGLFAAVLNSLWQAAMVAAIVWLALKLMARINMPFNAATRYVIWWAALAMVLVLPLGPRMLDWWHTRTVIAPTIQMRHVAPAVSAPPLADPPVVVTLRQDRPAKWPLFIVALWAALCVFRLSQIGRSYLYLRGVKRRAAISTLPLPPISRPADLLISTEIASPMAVGFLRPAVVLPESLREEITPQELEHVLLHETAHIARRDDWTNLAARLLGAALALHPVAVWILRQIDRERETACDDWVVAKTGAARPYAASLARMFELRATRRGGVQGEALASGIFGGGSRLGERIELLLKRGREFSPRVSTKRVAAGILGLMGTVVAGSLAPRWIAFAQTRAEFEVASIRPTPSELRGDPQAVRPEDGFTAQQLSSGNLNYVANALIEYIKAAYGLKPYQLPKTLPQDLYQRYDIAAKAGGPATDAQMKLMLQTLLLDRFKLKVHRETKELPVYALIVGKTGPKFSAATDDGKSGVRAVSASGIKWHNITMDYLADWVSSLPSLGRPVLDRTGLRGGFDFTLAVDGLPDKGEEASAKAGIREALDASIFGSLQALGLKLESDKAQVDLYTIEHVEKPGEN
jgi:uncharacterized protein (TIGR03435 family)